MAMLDVALGCIKSGWYVFPCMPTSKRPHSGLAPHGFKDASNEIGVIESWWKLCPAANVAIATGPSKLCVVDFDHGLADADALIAWLETRILPLTFAVRTGRRPEFGVQLYYSGENLKSTGWEHNGIKGDIRCETGYVMAPGSVHPDTGERYEVLWNTSTVSVPEFIKTLTTKATTFDDAEAIDDATADEWKTWLYQYANRYSVQLRGYEKRVPNGWWLGIECPWSHEHSSGTGVESSTVLGVLDGKLAFECSHGTCKAAKRDTRAFKTWAMVAGDWIAEPGADPTIILGSGKREDGFQVEPVDWRSRFHTLDEVTNCPPPTFLIENFLAKQAICALAAPVAQRKSLIALNVVRSLCTGAALFGFMPVITKPKRVLYLCPEMGLISLSARIKAMGLESCIGDTLFMRSMNLGDLKLEEIPDEALFESVLIVDTAVRFMQGDENKVSDTRNFSKLLFDTQRRQGPDGAIMVLYHSPKATKGAFELTLENCLRGSGEIGAAITDAHGTRLQDSTPDKAYASTSFISHVKARDYQGVEDFEVHCDLQTTIMTRVGAPGTRAVLNTKDGGYKANKDGMDDAAKAVIAANPDLSIRQLVAVLEDAGIKRQKTWVSDAKSAMKGNGSKLSE